MIFMKMKKNKQLIKWLYNNNYPLRHIKVPKADQF